MQVWLMSWLALLKLPSPVLSTVHVDDAVSIARLRRCDILIARSDAFGSPDAEIARAGSVWDAVSLPTSRQVADVVVAPGSG